MLQNALSAKWTSEDWEHWFSESWHPHFSALLTAYMIWPKHRNKLKKFGDGSDDLGYHAAMAINADDTVALDFYTGDYKWEQTSYMYIYTVGSYTLVRECCRKAIVSLFTRSDSGGGEGAFYIFENKPPPQSGLLKLGGWGLFQDDMVIFNCPIFRVEGVSFGGCVIITDLMSLRFWLMLVPRWIF